MSLKEIKQKLKEIFSSMKVAGLIIIPEDFKKIKSRYFGKRRTDLTRIWGAEYLRDKINESENLKDQYDVPNYVIVAEDPNHLKINLWFNNENFPVASTISNASIYFEKISGKPIASWNSYMVHDLGKNPESDMMISAIQGT